MRLKCKKINKIFFINTVFSYFFVYQTLSQAHCPEFLGIYRKRNTHSRLAMKELWEVGVETATSHGEENEKDIHEEKEPHGL